jgi:single-strand DNA-binding protein
MNKVILIGNVGNDPEIRSVGSGTKVAQISLATSKKWTNQNGEKQEKTEWHRCVIWNNKDNRGMASTVEQYVKKGDKISVEGEIEYRQWQDKDGQTRYTTEIKVKELVLLGGGQRGEGGGPSSGGSSSGASKAKPAAKKPANDDFGDFPAGMASDDDDLPF